MADFSGKPKPLYARDVQVRPHGPAESFDYRMYAHNSKVGDEKQTISMWHDVALYPESSVVNMICEIPKTTRKKFEISTTEGTNPIKQDVKDGQLREFLKGDVYFNYGCIPQTWEDPNEVDPDAGHPGDNDPLDVCEIGLRIMKVGEVLPVKLLGVLCLIDEGETDWKLICISTNDPWSAILHDIADVEHLLPGTLDAIREWFRSYKIPHGSPPNTFGFDGKYQNAEFATNLVQHCHKAWQKLLSGAYELESGENSPSKPAATKSVTGATRRSSKNLAYPKKSSSPAGSDTN